VLGHTQLCMVVLGYARLSSGVPHPSKRAHPGALGVHTQVPGCARSHSCIARVCSGGLDGSGGVFSLHLEKEKSAQMYSDQILPKTGF